MSEERFSLVVPKIKQQYILNLLEKGKRLDNRNFDEMRPIKIKTGIIPNAEGSAEVHLGDTIVLTGVKMSITNPYPDQPDKGTLIVNSEFPPVASPDFEPGPPDENAIELARIIDRGLRKPEAIDFSSLCIIPSKKVYGVWIDIYVLNHNGNLVDAAGISTLAALLNTKYRKAEVNQQGEVVLKDELVNLKIINYPVYLTFGKILNYILLDMNLEEEIMSQGRLTVIISGEGKICGLQKSGIGYFELNELEFAIKKSLSMYQSIKDLILKNVNK
jgi:exosome complex component RRP42